MQLLSSLSYCTVSLSLDSSFNIDVNVFELVAPLFCVCTSFVVDFAVMDSVSTIVFGLVCDNRLGVRDIVLLFDCTEFVDSALFGVVRLAFVLGLESLSSTFGIGLELCAGCLRNNSVVVG